MQTTNETTQAYLDLQNLDQKILKLKNEMNGKADHISEEKLAYRKLDKSLENTREVLKKTKVELELKKTDLAAVSEKRDHLAEKLKNIKSNKEYKAIEKEGKNYREEAEALTKYVEAATENISRLEKSLETGDEDLKTMKENIKGLILEHKNSQEAIISEIDTLNNQRKEQVKVIQDLEKDLSADQQFLDIYEKLTRLPNGDALAQMENDTCQGCYMRVNTQLASKIKSLRRLATCTSCHRILYVRD